MVKHERMTQAEIMRELNSGSRLDNARKVFSGILGRREQQAAQEGDVGPIERRRREFEDVKRIAEALGVSLD